MPSCRVEGPFSVYGGVVGIATEQIGGVELFEGERERFGLLLRMMKCALSREGEGG